MGAAAGDPKTTAARQRHDPDRPGQGQASAVFQGQCRGDPDPDPVHRRRQDQGPAAKGAAYAGGACEGLEDCDDPGRHASDVRTGAAKILRDRAGIPGGVTCTRLIASTTTFALAPPWMPLAA